jgi:hypothetical protein
VSPIVSDAATPQFDLPRSTEVHSYDVSVRSLREFGIRS